MARPRVALASRAFGNILAHATVDVSEGALHKEEISGVRFVKYKDERAVYYVSFEGLKNEISKLVMYSRIWTT